MQDKTYLHVEQDKRNLLYPAENIGLPARLNLQSVEQTSVHTIA